MTTSFNQILNITRSGMLTRLLDLENASHNLANVNTAGFKSSRVNFQELLEAQQLNGVTIQGTQHLMEQGSLRSTENPMDLAIEGVGFFSVELPDGRTAYTRDGQFYLDSERQVVTANGFHLVWDGEIPEGAEDFHVNPDGSVMILQEGAWEQVGTIELSSFANASGLIGYGQNLWLASPISGEAQTGTPETEGLGKILGSAVEQSNVNLAEEMTHILSLQRSFEMSLRVFQQTDQMLAQAIQMRQV